MLIAINSWILYGLTGFSILSFLYILIEFILLNDVIIPYLKAKITGSSVSIRRIQNGKFKFYVGAQKKGTLESENGIHGLKTSYIGPAGVPLILIDDRVGVSLDTGMLNSVNQISGIASDYEELKSVVTNKTQKVSKNLLDAFENIDKYFKYNVNPTYIRAIKANVTADAIEEYKKTDWIKFVTLITVILMVGTICFVIIQSQTGGGVDAAAQVGGTTAKVIGTSMS